MQHLFSNTQALSPESSAREGQSNDKQEKNLEAWFQKKLYERKTESQLNLLKYKGKIKRKVLENLRMCSCENIVWKDFLNNEKELINLNIREPIKLDVNDFQLRGVISEKIDGNLYLMKINFGKNGKFCAVKKILTCKLEEKSSNILNEIKILKTIRCPFTINAQFEAQDVNYTYLIMPLIVGKDLYRIIKKFGFIQEKLAKFYSAQILLALEYLHNLDIVFRNLKPENIMVDHIGYLKVHDFKYAKHLENNGRTYTICGTPEYMAPECINLQGYGKSVDWWAFGILVYEMSTGITPFYDQSQEILLTNIISGKYNIKHVLSFDLRNFIEKFIKIEPTERFGLSRLGVNEIKQDRWFTSINWHELVHKRLKPLYLPNIRNPRGNFLVHKIEIPKEESEELFYCDD